MVQTRPAVNTTKPAQPHGNDAKDTTVENSRNGASPPAKNCRRRNVAAPKKRRRGEPGELCRLNLDVLFLIAAYIHPLDLLNLARTCKSLRALLMDKSSAFVWRCTRHQVKGLPDCPADLTEPEYANLVFYTRCHGCGKHAKAVLWGMRRRYCPDCRDGRLCCLSSCPEIIRNVLAVAPRTIKKGSWVDREQMDSLMDEYRRSSDKEQFLSDREEQYDAICEHARDCEDWQRNMHQDDMRMRREERAASIFERLKQHGYDLEVEYFGRCQIQNARRFLFETTVPLTDKGWSRIWPEWHGTMNDFRSQRLESVVYRPRRNLLVSAYKIYVMFPSPNTPAFDLLPRVADIARFPVFRDIIRAPEEARIDSESFASAFAQLPALVGEWRKKLDAELAELVNIPSHLSIQDTSGVASNGVTTHTEPSRTATDRLRLACALFHSSICEGVFTHPEAFSAMYRYIHPDDIDSDDSERTGSTLPQPGVEFMGQAPYIVHASGLDPNVATVEDMDRRNARLKCMRCQDQYVRSWRDALWHKCRIKPSLHPGPKSPRWQIVSDEHMGAIQAAELSVEKDSIQHQMRCLLCRPCVGDAMSYELTISHLMYLHEIEEGDIKRGVHFAFLTVETCSVEMVEEGGQVTFI